MSFDYVIVGAGLYGATFARRIAENGYSTMLVDRRKHPQEYEAGREAFYPIGDSDNLEKYQQYHKLAETEAAHVRFGGRLGTYQYFDMHQVIGQALKAADDELPLGSSQRRA